MKEKIYRRVEYYLYNYMDIDKIIESIRIDYIDCVNVSANAWLKGKRFTSKTVENQAIKIADDVRINNLKKAKKIIKHYMNILRERSPRRYNFIKLKYFEKATPKEISKKLKYDYKQQKDITDMVVSFFYKQFRKVGMGGM